MAGRMNQTMAKLQKMSNGDYSSFQRVLFGLSTPSPVPADLDEPNSVSGKVEWIDPSLNGSQKEAIRFALASREVVLIHGPPGVSFIAQLVRGCFHVYGLLFLGDWVHRPLQIELTLLYRLGKHIH